MKARDLLENGKAQRSAIDCNFAKLPYRYTGFHFFSIQNQFENRPWIIHPETIRFS